MIAARDALVDEVAKAIGGKLIELTGKLIDFDECKEASPSNSVARSAARSACFWMVAILCSAASLSMASPPSAPTSSTHTPNAITRLQNIDDAFSTPPDGTNKTAISPINPAIIIQSPVVLSALGEAIDNSQDRNGSFKSWAHVGLLAGGLLVLRWALRKWRK